MMNEIYSSFINIVNTLQYLINRLTRYGIQQTGKSVVLSIQVGSTIHEVEVRIQASISSSSYQSQSQPQQPQPQQSYQSSSYPYQPQSQPQQPYQSSSYPYQPQPQPQQPYHFQLQSSQVEPVVTTEHTLRWKGQPGKEGDVTIRDNNIEIPAGITTSRVFKTVVHNYSNKKIIVQIDPLQAPFHCSYTDVVIQSYVFC